MNKTFTILTLALCCSLKPAIAQNDPKAKTILDAVSKKVNGLKTLKADFSISLTGGKGGKVNDTKKGSATIKGQKYHVSLSGQEIICDTKTIWTYNKETKEVQVSNFNPNEQSMSPAKLLTNFYDKEYKYSYIGEKKAKGKNFDEIELSPIDKAKQVAKIELMIDKATSLISGGDIWQKNGNKSTYSVTNYVLNKDVPDSYFTWDSNAHPGVEVVDLR
jgi:outer membrane lipoprotein-sorting protein